MTIKIIDDFEIIFKILDIKKSKNSPPKNYKKIFLQFVSNYNENFFDTLNENHPLKKQIVGLLTQLNKNLFYLANNLEKENLDFEILRQTEEIMYGLNSIISTNPGLFIKK